MRNASIRHSMAHLYILVAAAYTQQVVAMHQTHSPSFAGTPEAAHALYTTHTAAPPQHACHITSLTTSAHTISDTLPLTPITTCTNSASATQEQTEPTNISELCTDATIACFYLASSIPHVGRTVSTVTDLVASTVWLGDGIRQTHDAHTKKISYFSDIAIPSLFIVGDIPILPVGISTGATVCASLLWLSDSIRGLRKAQKKYSIP